MSSENADISQSESPIPDSESCSTKLYILAAAVEQQLLCGPLCSLSFSQGTADLSERASRAEEQNTIYKTINGDLKRENQTLKQEKALLDDRLKRMSYTEKIHGVGLTIVLSIIFACWPSESDANHVINQVLFIYAIVLGIAIWLSKLKLLKTNE